MSNLPILINRDISIFYGNIVRASRELRTPRITDINGGNTPLLMGNNVITTNDDSLVAGNDGGICVERFQTTNDTGAGDVVSDTPPAETGTSQTHSGLDNNEIKLDATNSAVNSFYNNWYIKITSGLHNNQVRQVLSYVGATRVAKMFAPWTPVLITGTVSTSATSTTVTGLGTSFTTELAVGDTIVINNEVKEIASITNIVTLDTITPYANTNINVSATLVNPSGGVTYDLYNKLYTCLFWDESAKKWQLAFSVDQAGSTISIISYADLCLGTLDISGISFDGGTNTLDTYIDWTAATVTSSLPGLNTITADAGTQFTQIGNVVTLNLNIEFDQLLALGVEFSGLFLVTGVPISATGSIHSNATLVSEFPAPLTSKSAMISMVPGTSIVFLRVIGGLTVASFRILATLIYKSS